MREVAKSADTRTAQISTIRNGDKKVKSPFAPGIVAFSSASLILSYLDYKGANETVLKQLNKNSREYIFIHGPMLRNVLVGSP